MDQIALYVLIALAVGGFALTARLPPERRLPLFVWMVPIISIAVVFPVIGSTRYRTVIYPFLALAAAPALVGAAARLKERTRPSA